MPGNVGSALRCSGGVQDGTGDIQERSTYAPVKVLMIPCPKDIVSRHPLSMDPKCSLRRYVGVRTILPDSCDPTPFWATVGEPARLEFWQGVDTSIVETPQQLNQLPKTSTSIHRDMHDPFFPHHGRRSMDTTAMGSGDEALWSVLLKEILGYASSKFSLSTG